MNCPFVVLRSNDNCFLDILRACGRCGIPTIPVVFTWEGATWISEKSCYYKNFYTICNPAEDEKKAAEDFVLIGRELLSKYGQKLMVIPSSDTNITFLYDNYDLFKDYYLLMGSADFSSVSYEQLRKDTSAELLKEAGVNIPETIAVKGIEDIDFSVNNISYPCVYKPVIKDLISSFQNTHNKKKAIECHSKEELRNKLKEEVENGYELVVQEKIEFDSLEDEVSCYVYANAKGEITMMSGQHKIMEHPHPYGTGVISVPYFDDEFGDIAQKVIDSYKWHGFLGIEFMKDKRSGKWVVIETNLRPWISINYQASIGYNYLKALYADMYSETPAERCIMPCECPDSIRVNLTMLVQKYASENNDMGEVFSSVCDLLRQHMGKTVFSYYTSYDEVPGNEEYISLLNKYPGFEQDLIKVFELVKENCNILK